MLNIKKITFLIIIISILYLLTVFSYAEVKYTDVNDSDWFSQSITRVTELGFMKGNDNNQFNPDGCVSREQFAKILLEAAGLSKEALNYKGKLSYADVGKSSSYYKYIGYAAKMGYLKEIQKGKFQPEESITFGQVCFAFLKVNGQNVKNESGNLIVQKARASGLTKKLDFKSGDKAPRWAIAVVMDRIWVNNLKKNKIKNINQVLAGNPEICEEYIILGDSRTIQTLKANQIMTDKGILSLSGTHEKLELGNKYRFITYDGEIIKVFRKESLCTNFTVKDIRENIISGYTNKKIEQIILPTDGTYYFQGEKQNLEKIRSILSPDSSIIFAPDESKNKYEYIVVFNPIYSKPETVDNYNGSTLKIGDINLDDNTVMIKNSEIITASAIQNRNLVYEVTDLWGQYKYILVVDNAVEGKITGILPNKLSPQKIEIDDKQYDIGPDMQLFKINSSSPAFKVGDSVAVLIGYDGKIADIVKLDYEAGKTTECIILSNASVSDSLSEDQVLTDKGLYYLNEKNMKLDLGNKYKVIVSDDTIVDIKEKVGSVLNCSVTDKFESSIRYTSGSALATMKLSEKTTFYHNGSTVAFSGLMELIQKNTSIILSPNNKKNGYDYAIVFDPLYGNPVIVHNINSDSTRIGNINFSNNPLIISDGDIISKSQIKERSILYEVTDIWKMNRYILVVNSIVEGKITNIAQSKISPQSVEIDQKSYTLFKNMDLNKLNTSTDSFKVGDSVAVLVGYDGKAVDIMKLDYEAGKVVECIILGNSSTSNNLDNNQVLTNQGVYYLQNSSMGIEVGNKYKVVVSGDTIVKVKEREKYTWGLTVNSFIGNTVKYKTGSGINILKLPDRITYYYKGSTISYSNLKDIIQVNSSIVIAYNDQNTGIEYAVIFDPIYSKPMIGPAGAVGSIIKNGDFINVLDINTDDVLYTITDIWSSNAYTLIVEKKTTGTIVSFTPDKFTPKSIKISTSESEYTYNFSDEFNIDSLNSVKIGDNVILLFGLDNNIIYIKKG